MSEQTATETGQNAPDNPEGQQPSEAAGSTPSDAPLEKTGFKWGEEAPAEWQGKTAAEAAEQYKNLVNATRQYVMQQQQAAAQPQPQAQPVAQAPKMDEKELSDLWFSDPAKAQQVFAQQVQQNIGGQVGQVLGPLYQAQAATARDSVAKEDPDFYRKYGAEVDAIVNSPAVSPQVRANPQTWRAAMKVVKGNHLDEIAAERAQVLATAAGNSVESGGGVGSVGAVGSANPLLEKMRESDYGNRLIEKYGERGMLDRLKTIQREDGTSPEKYVEMVARTKVVRDPDRPGEWKNKTIARDVS